MQFLPPALAALGAWPQFVCWFAAPHPVTPGKFNKFPCDWRTGDVVDAHDPQFWTTAEVALAAAARWDRGHGSGPGFVFTDADPFFFGDVDGALQPDGQWSPLAIELCTRLTGAAVEVSHSGRGLHIIGRTAPLAHTSRNIPLHLELYTSKRFVALTGTNALGDAAADVTAGLWAVAAQYFPPQSVTLADDQDWTSQPVAEFTGPTDDDDLLRRAAAGSAKSPAAVFGTGAGHPTFRDLWEANADALAARWPGEDGKPFGQSEADQSLANLLAFWTGKDCERMERLMRRSALARGKYDDARPGGTYLTETIRNACRFVARVYATVPDKPAPAPAQALTEPTVVTAAASGFGRELRNPLHEYMGPFEQLAHFDRCFFDNMTGRIYSLPKNTEFTKATFDVNYGGHLFVMDPGSQKQTDSAWDAYTKSRVNRPVIVDALAFQPERPAGELVRDGRRVYANSYVPHEPKLYAGDASRFTDHVRKMLPDAGDYDKFMAYIASLVQNPGVKFQWWPVLQGVQGGGKTLIFDALEYAVGHEYTHKPNAQQMAKEGIKFNKWIYRKLLILVEEIYVNNRREFLEEFKPIVTNRRIPMEGKGENQVTGDNRANGVLGTNHYDGVPIDPNERRYGIFYTAHQSEADLLRDGLTKNYFMDLWDWMDGKGAYAYLGERYGAAVVANFLLTMPITAELDPARESTRAPVTTSTAAAMIHSHGRAEQEVAAAVDEGRPGFAGGWVSSVALDGLLDSIKAHVPRNKRHDMLLALGYVQHPALDDGRTSGGVAPDNRRTRLYVRAGHLALNMTNPAMVEDTYTKAQVGQAAATAFKR